MRYCCHCGNPLSPGASFCHTCGAALKTLVPEADETHVAVAEVVAEPVAEIPVAPIVEPVVEPVFAPVVATPAEEVVPAAPAYNQREVLEEKEFLDQTHRLLRWERKAWNIAGKVGLITGIVFPAIYLISAIVSAFAGDSDSAPLSALFVFYSIIYIAVLLVPGIVCLKAAGRIPQYTDTLYKNFDAAHKRCGSIGMIVFCYLFNGVALVFYVINFVRMKTNKPIIDRILTRQGVK